MKCKLLTILMTTFLVVVMTTPAFAGTLEKNTTMEVRNYDDGSYATIETVEEIRMSTFAITSTKSASRTYTYYSKNNVAEWTFTLKGSFSYNGSTAKATAASSSYNIFVSGWKCSTRNSSTSGSIAKANATFKYLTLTKNISLGLKCSPTGTISAA